MVEYLILLAASGSRVLDRVTSSVTEDPVLLWGGVAAVVLVMIWVLKPNR